jgi:hypothetical protein
MSLFHGHEPASDFIFCTVARVVGGLRYKWYTLVCQVAV